MRRTFDLLTRPVFDDECIETGSNITWKNSRDFRITVAAEVASFFEFEASFDPPRFSVRAQRVGPCSDLVRFAATVECETDEVDAQAPAQTNWPPLRSSKIIDPPFRGVQRPGGTSAWEQMLGQRDEMLAVFDVGKRRAKGHRVRTHHGRVAEASFRGWLSAFLPKRYGVTSGFVVSQGQRGDAVFPHFDVIIYDLLDAPVLWMDDNPDMSVAGTSRALPAEYVRAVLEVKATYGSDEAKSAMEHLRELAPFYAGLDSEEQRYKQFLPMHFFSAVVFFDASSAAQQSEAARSHLVPSAGPRNFYGGVILRGDGQAEASSGNIRVLVHPDNGLDVMTFWGASGFSIFAFDLIALLNGTFESGRISSLHSIRLPPE